MYHRGPLPVQGYALWTLQCPSFIPAAHGPRALRPPVVTMPGLSFWSHHRPGSLVWGAHQESRLSVPAAPRIWPLAKAGQVLLFSDPSTILGAHYFPRWSGDGPGQDSQGRRVADNQCKRDVQQFLGFANYYRRFIRDFAQLARPLYRLTEQTAPFKWSDSLSGVIRRDSEVPLLSPSSGLPRL